VLFDEPLARHTSLRVGGPADALASPPSRDKLVELSRLCDARGVPVLVLGKGFNTLVRDGGVRGVVVRLHALRAVSREGTRVDAEAGVTHTTLTRFCADEGLSGLEFAVGIPGTVGGWLRMNAGIPEREMRHVTERLSYLDRARHEIVEAAADSIGWAYRQLALPGDAVLVAGAFRLEPDEPGAIRARMQEYMERRRETQPVDRLSCGSVFVNPPGDHAGRLIEAAGLKGEAEGGARISFVHANFIVNEGGASAADVLALIERAQQAVRHAFGVTLEPEVRIVGEQ
jgi:UDP-N-acetylmuramate dehydrogenase